MRIHITKKSNRFSLVLVLIMCLCCLHVDDIQATDVSSKLKVGDFVEFGQYNNEPILWRIIHFDDDGDPLLFSEYILGLKAFDSTGGTHDKTGQSSYRDQFGSNNWQYSNIRQWLNSDESEIIWLQNPPSEANLKDAYSWIDDIAKKPSESVDGEETPTIQLQYHPQMTNSYSDEKGFLANGNFTEAERNLIKTKAHKVLLSPVDEANKTGGEGGHNFNPDIKNAVMNYDDARYQIIEDNVFFLSIQELKQYVADRGWECRKYPSKTSLIYSYHPHGDFRENSFWWYWLRTPMLGTWDGELGQHSYMRIVNNGGASSATEVRFNGGVAPACYLEMDSINAFTGLGTQTSPYQIQPNGHRAINEPSSWARVEVEKARQYNLTTDRVEQNFQETITREEFCELAIKLYEALSNQQAPIFRDNPFVDTHHEDVLKAYQLGIVDGIGNQRFSPNTGVTREQIAVMFYRTLGAIPSFEVKDDYTISFSDEADISSWAKPAVAYMGYHGIVSGVGDNRVNPKGNTTKEQAILLVVRMYERYQ